MTMDDAVGLGRLLLVLAETTAFLVAGGYAVFQFFEFATLGHTGHAFADPERKAAGMVR